MTLARSTPVRLAAGAVVAALALAGCAEGDDGASPSPSVTMSTPAPSETMTMPMPSESESESVPSTSEAPSASVPPPPSSEPPADKPTKIKVTINGTEVTTASDTVTVAAGDTIRIIVTTDADDELHVHGVEQTADLVSGVKNKVDVVIPSDLVPGVYEVETHESALLLFSLEVS